MTRKLRVLPVIHCRDWEQVKKNAALAHECEADGVFLINQGSTAKEVLAFAAGVAKGRPEWWVGVNCLGQSNAWIVEQFPGALRQLGGIWSDCLESTGVRWGEHGLYFGGVAFKGQAQPADLSAAAKAALPHCDVITTSGDRTGMAPAVEKIRTIREAIPADKPLAVASGITPENVRDFLPYVDYVLVATGISKNYHELDRDKLQRLVAICRETR